jgi:hypothetical protein
MENTNALITQLLTTNPATLLSVALTSTFLGGGPPRVCCPIIHFRPVGGLDQSVDGGGALATFVGTGKGLNISLTRKAWSCVRHFPGETQSKDPAGIVAPVR